MISLADLQKSLPETALFGNTQTTDSIGWALSPTPYYLTTKQTEFLKNLGGVLFRFNNAIESLYRQSLKDISYAWIKEIFHAGKPASLISFSQMHRIKHDIPLVIRPDLLVTENGFTLTELDSVPGGIGFTSALNVAYREAGFNVIEAADGMPEAFLKALQSLSGDQPAKIAIVVSNESADYYPEMAWLVEKLQKSYPDIHLIRPDMIRLHDDILGFHTKEGSFQPINVIYRFFELFDLPNISQIELIQYAIKKRIVTCTPPFKPFFEEKIALALIHHPFLISFWVKHLSTDDFSCLKNLIPESWILDPAPIPPEAAVIPSLALNDKLFQRFADLAEATQKQRELVIKPSGFSPLAWGSRGVKIGHDLPQEAWKLALEEALNQFSHTPHLLQRFVHAAVKEYQFFNPQSGEVQTSEGRTRLTPYYFVNGETPLLAGILATTCRKDKKIIHGMKDGVMSPAAIK